MLISLKKTLKSLHEYSSKRFFQTNKMEIQDYLKEIKNFHQILLNYFDEGDQNEEEYQHLITLITNNQIEEHRYKLKNFLYLLVNISNNYRIHANLYSKIEHLILLFKEKIIKDFSNHEIFKIFKSNKRILLFLSSENMLTFDNSIVEIMKKDKYMEKNYLYYFYPEIKELTKVNMEIIQKITKGNPDLFKEMREKGGIAEDNNDIKYLIQNDLIEEFIIYINKTQISLNLRLEPTIFETNSFLISKKVSLIEYAAFFGSSQIFKYLYLNHAILQSTIWPYAIHGRHPEIITILEEQKLIPNGSFFQQYFAESIKCHHVEITNYLLDNYNQLTLENQQVNLLILKTRNYSFLPNELNKDYLFFYLCRYNYVQLVTILLKTMKVDANKEIIS